MIGKRAKSLRRLAVINPAKRRVTKWFGLTFIWDGERRAYQDFKKAWRNKGL